jgi:hypothetical protein
MKANGISLLMLIFVLQSTYAQKLLKGYNYCLYTSNFNRILFQEVNNINDSVLEIKSTVFKVKDSVSFLNANLIQKKMMFFSIDTTIESDTSRIVLFDTLHYLKRPKIIKNSVLLSWTRGEYLVDFNSNGVDSINNYIFDLKSFYATKRSKDNDVAEFESVSGLFNFERFVFLKDFWVIQYISEQPNLEAFSLVEFNNSKFDGSAILKKLESK